MTNSIVVKQSDVDGIEFYVSNDGAFTGMSQTGLAKLCGIARSTLQNLLNKAADKIESESLRIALDKTLWLPTEAPNNAEVIPSDTCARIIAYYAFESKTPSFIAKYSFEKFASKGISTWIKEVTGYQDNQLPQATEILNLLNQLLNKVDKLEKETQEYRTMRGRTVTVFPALDKMLEEFAVEDELLLPEEHPENYTLTEWILATKKGVLLDKSAKHRLALLVAETYRTLTGKEPKRENRVDKETRKRANQVSVYNYNEFPILQLAWNKAFNM
jgi:hypothetical protein